MMTSDSNARLLPLECAQLTDLGDGMAAQLAALEREFIVDRAEHLISNLAGAATYVRRLVVARNGGAE